MGITQSDIARGHAYTIARKMELEAMYENKPNHIRHVKNQISYADAVGEYVMEQMKAWVMTEVPIMIQKELSKPQNKVKVQAKVDEKSLSDAKRKITDMIKSIFH